MIPRRFDNPVRVLFSFLLFSFLLAASARADTGWGESPLFAIDTEFQAQASAFANSPLFSIKTRFYPSATASASSGLFSISTTGLSWVVSEAESGLFSIDTALLLAITPERLEFGSVNQNGASVERSFTVRNFGSKSRTLSCSTDAPFQMATASPVTVNAGETVSVTVRFTPGADAGSYSRNVRFSTGNMGILRQATAGVVPVYGLGSIYGKVTTTSAGAGAGMAGGSPAQLAETPVAGAWMMPFRAGTTQPYGQPTYSNTLGDYRIRTGPGTYDLLVAPTNAQGCILFEKVKLERLTVSANQDLLANCSVQIKSSTPLPNREVPIVLVRGRGKDKNWEDDEKSYWAEARTYLKGALFQHVWDCNDPEGDTKPGHVINGTKSIRDNASSLHNYIQLKSDEYAADPTHGGKMPDRIFIVAHSMGGLITRQMLTDLDQSGWDIPPVKKVVMLSTPNAGSRLADRAYEAYLGIVARVPSQLVADAAWNLLDPKTAATEDLKTHNFYSSGKFAVQNPWPTGIELYLLGGSFDAETVLKSALATVDDLQCAAGALMLTQFTPGYRDNPNDGAVTLGSAQGMYSLGWIYSGVAGSTPSYEPNLVSCFENGTPILPFRDTHQNHSRIRSDLETLQYVGAILSDSAAAAAQKSSQLASEVLDSSESDTGLDLRRIEQQEGVLVPAEHRELIFPCDSLTTVTVAVISEGSSLTLKLRTPQGTLINPIGDTLTSGVQYVAVPRPDRTGGIAQFIIAAPQAGEWTAILDAPSTATAATPFTLTVSGFGRLDIYPDDGQQFGWGQGPVLLCQAASITSDTTSSDPITSVTVHATATNAANGTLYAVDLYDDGGHGDGLIHDGVSGGFLSTSTQAGVYQVAWRAEGVDPATGYPFRRLKETQFVVSTANAFIAGGLSHESYDLDGDSQTDQITVECLVSARKALSGYLTGDLVDSSGEVRISASQAFERQQDETAGVTLRFHKGSIPIPGNFGPWHMENLALWESATTGTVWLDNYQGQYEVNVSLKGPGLVTHQVSFQTDGTPGATLAGETPQTVTDGSSATSVTAIAPVGYHFVKWTLNGTDYSTSNPLVVDNVTEDMAFTANFAINEYVLTVTKAGTGQVTTEPSPGINGYAEGTVVILTAIPDAQMQFDGWSGDLTGTQSPITITMTDNKSVTATFSPVPVGNKTLALTVTPSAAVVAGCAVSKTPDAPSYAPGTTVTLAAMVATGWHFVAWSGDATGTSTTVQVTLDADKLVTATFALNEYTLAVEAVGTTGTVSVSPNQTTYTHGTTVTLTATPLPGYRLARWEGDVPAESETVNPLTLKMTSNRTIRAVFERIPAVPMWLISRVDERFAGKRY